MRWRLFSLLAILTLAGCGGNRIHPERVADEFVYEDPKVQDMGLRDVEICVRDWQDGKAFNDTSDDPQDRSMIYHAYFRISTAHPDSVHLAVTEMALNMGGFVLESGTDQTVIRVPAAKLDEATARVEHLGKVVDKKVIGEDVTDQHYDFKIRLENAKKSRVRYLELLEKAINVEDILKIERELDRLNNEIDYLQGKLNRMEHMIEYVKMTVRTSPGPRPGPVGWVFYQAYLGAKWLFVRD
ncbi:MAG: DUF4349 domain-containing protein [Candidatus Zixiibacteriota bacterium]|nr:MAG: DUF4349 domain-containing protein [candidate division Zixibacteria bacterium]